MSQRDQITYKYPRTTIEAFGCDAQSANAIECTRQPMAARITDAALAVIVGIALAVAAGAYFDVLTK